MGRRKIIAGDPDEIDTTKTPKRSVASRPALNLAKGSKGRFWQIALVLAACFSLAGFGLMSYYYQLEQAELKLLRSGQSSLEYKKKEAAGIVADASKLAVLPLGVPLAVQLADQELSGKWSLLAEAKQGDWLLIYPQGVYVYRPGSRQLVATGELKPADVPKASVATVAIRNGGALQGAASEMADKLKPLNNLNIIEIGNAATNTYQGNILFNQSAKPADQLLGLVKAVATATLPTGEASTSADYLLIIGN